MAAILPTPSMTITPAATPARSSPWTAAIRQSLTLILFSVFLLTTLWVAVSYQIRREADDALRNAEIDLANLTRAFAEHTAKTLQGADQALRFVRSEYADHRKQLDIGAYLERNAVIDSELHLISIIGADGFVTHSSRPFQRVDLRDREHFRVHAQGRDDKLFISKPVLGRVSGKWSIQLTRRVDAPDGSFDGVVVLSLSPDYLTRFYGDVDLGAHGAITLVGYDGVVRARATRDSNAGAQDLSTTSTFQEAMRRKSGTLRATSKIDEVERVSAFRSLDQYGLLVFTGMGVDDVMAQALERRRAYLVGAALVSVVIVGFVAGLVRRARQQWILVQQLEASNRQAQAANQMKTKFLASVSHELRTPLNGILGYAEMLKDTAPDVESREFGQIIHQSASHLHGLVNTILDLAKIESGRMGVTLAPVTVAELLTQAKAHNLSHAQSRGLELSLAVTPGCPAQITSDAMRLRQVLNNLIHNAIKFTDAGSVLLSARAEGDELVIEVVDTGCGIAPAMMDSIFTRFHTTTSEFVHPGQGAGLGLPLAHELAELLGGRLQVHSVVGSGTTAQVRLPIAGPPPRAKVDDDD